MALSSWGDSCESLWLLNQLLSEKLPQQNKRFEYIYDDGKYDTAV